MDSELAGLEHKLAALLAEYHRLRAENESLQRELARAHEQSRALTDKMAAASIAPRRAAATVARGGELIAVEDRGTMLDVSILGREYRVACKESERDDLMQAVQYLDQRMREIRDAGKIAGTERIAVMAALNITHELLGNESATHRACKWF